MLRLAAASLLDIRGDIRLVIRAVILAAMLATVACDATVRSDCCQVSLTITVPDETPVVYLAGNLDELGPWSPDGIALQGDDRERSVTVTAPYGTDFEYKFTLGGWDREALSDTGQVMGNYRLHVGHDQVVQHDISAFKRDPRDYIADWQGAGVKGRLVYWTDVESAFLEHSRHVEIWLPPGYDGDPDRRYPVLYMHDGQNLFDPRLANTGIDWGVDEAIVELTDDGQISPPIVVGVWNSADRTLEYSPWHGAADYARFLIEELKPRVDAEFRTQTGPEHTMAMGSSMGGLLSFYLVTHHPEVFSACGCLSTHFLLSAAVMKRFKPLLARVRKADSTPYILRDIADGATVPDQARFWFDYGGKGHDAHYADTHDAVRQWLISQGKIDGRDFVIRQYPEADHNEAAWRARLGDSLRFLYSDQ